MLITDILLNTSEKQRNEGKDKGGEKSPVYLELIMTGTVLFRLVGLMDSRRDDSYSPGRRRTADVSLS